MITYYLHHTPGEQPLFMLSEYPLDLQPGSWIYYQDCIFKVDHQYPIVQNRDTGLQVHVRVQQVKDMDGNPISGRQTMADLNNGTFFMQFGN